MPSKLYIICEGQSESAFVNEMLCQYVGEKTKWQLRLIPITITTSTRKSSGKVFKGGLRNYGKIKNELKKIITTGESVSTMIDYYGLPSDFPGYNELKKFYTSIDKVKHLEKSLLNDILKEYSNVKKDFFIPYIQLHEFETLFFSDLLKLKEFYLEIEEQKAIDKLANETEGMSPEEINNGFETAPSKRLAHAINYHKGKTIAGPMKKINIDKMRERCPHFNEWVKKILGL